MIVIKGGRVLTTEGWANVDVLVDEGVITEMGTDVDPGGAGTIDAAGMYVGPGLVDLHTHLREPGQTWKEDISSGSRSAAAGGFTAVVAMPNTDPPIDSPKIVGEVRRRGQEVGIVDVSVAASLTRGRSGVAVSDVEALYEAGVRVFTDDGDSVADTEVMREAMQVIGRLPGAVVAQHAEDASLTIGGHLNEGPIAEQSGIGALPSAAEVRILERDLALVRETGTRYHFQHVSSAASVELLRKAKAEGLPVTSEVAPHHLTFEDRALRTLDTNFKMYPPIRSDADRSALREALIDRTIDIVATDHAPHTPSEKDVSFEQAPRGVIGLETAASAVFEVVDSVGLLFEVMSLIPARIGGFDDQGRILAPGASANLTVFDPNERWVPETFASKSANSPYLGREMTGRVKATISGGNVVYRMEPTA